MKYIELYNLLQSKVNYNDELIVIDSTTTVRNYTFVSKKFNVLPGETSYCCSEHDYATNKCSKFDNTTGFVNEVLDIPDSKIRENITFRYHVFMPGGEAKASEVVIMLHGFNEKTWDKYLPWAKRIVETTGKAVVLFPIAFHMNRAPLAWTDSRMMYEVSAQRKQEYPAILHSSLSNAAISTRIHTKPERYIWSGLQAYYDVIQLIEECKAGQHPAISPDAAFDLFGYSIGAFLSQILMLTNQSGYFDNSKLAMFCGGAVFNRLSPVSKFILDSEANVNLYSYIVEHLESHLKKDERLNHYLSPGHPEGLSLRAMLDYRVLCDTREADFRTMSDRMMAVTLTKDTVVPPYEVMNTVQGRDRSIPVCVEEIDFPYPYKHEDPFPALEKYKDEVDGCFNQVFEKLCDFLQ